MSDKPNAATATPEASEASKQDSTLLVRRLVVWAAAVVLALLTSGFILQVGVKLIWPNNGSIPLDATIPISFVNPPLLPLMMIPMTLFFVIWVDYIFRTRVVND